MIGNEAVWNRLSGPQDLHPRLLGMDLLRYLGCSFWHRPSQVKPTLQPLISFDHFFRLGLERSHSAEEAVTVITSLLESHGQVSSFQSLNIGQFSPSCGVSMATIKGFAQGGQCSNIFAQGGQWLKYCSGWAVLKYYSNIA